MRYCNKCGAEIDNSEIFRNSVCAACGAELKVCLNCKFYAPGQNNDCRESSAELVREKDRANFCDYFSFKQVTDKTTGKPDNQDKAKKQFESLFGD